MDPNAPSVAPVVTCHGVNIPDNPYLGPQRIRAISRGRYEAQEISAALRSIGPADRVLELGAGIGIVGAVIAHACRPARIDSYEANPALIPIIQTLYDVNNLTNIRIHHAVISCEADPPATVPFYIHGSFLGSSLRPRKRARDVVDVAVTRFEDVRRDLNPTAIVMDIDGAELDLVPQMDLGGVRVVSMELHPAVYGSEGIDRIFRSLMAQGLSYSVKASDGPVVTFTRA